MAKTLSKWVFGLTLVVLIFFAGRQSKPTQTQTVPHFTTVYETVTHIDTAWKIKLIKETKWDTVFTEKVVTVMQPETVLVTDTLSTVLNGIVVVEVGKDTTKVLGQKITADTGNVYREPWQVNYFTAGPLVALSSDTFPPRIKFGPKPKSCNFGCGIKKVGIGFGLGLNVGLLIFTVFGK